MRGSRPARGVARRRPAQQIRTEHQPGLVLAQDERAVGELIEGRIVSELRARAGVDALGVELCVDRVDADLTGPKLTPDRDEAVVVLASAECAGSVTGGERRRLVEEEQLGEPARL